MLMYNRYYFEIIRTASFPKTGSSVYLKMFRLNTIILTSFVRQVHKNRITQNRTLIRYSSFLHCPKKKQKTLVKKNSLRSNSFLTGIPLLNVFLDATRFIYVIAIFLLVLFFSFSTKAQSLDTTFQVVDSFSIHTTFLTTDALQQIYIATDEGKIIKLSKEGKKLFEYNNRRLGQVRTIDATNPFNILVYYSDLATIVLLDRTLSAIKEINLFDLNIFEVQAIGLSNDNLIWIYDPIESQLKKINNEGDILFQSRHLNQAVKSTLNINFLIERNNRLYLNDPSKGIFVFDNFGQLQEQLPITGLHQFQLLQEQLIYLKDGLIHYYNLETGETQISENPHLTKAIMARVLPQQTIMAQKDMLFLINRK